MADLQGAPLVCLMGPTAVGKTELALDLCRHLPCEIISVDSAMVYRGLDIGTAKPSVEILRQAPHRLIDVCEPDEFYSAGRFRTEALEEIRCIQRAGRIPLLVGGSGLYFRTLTQGLSRLPDASPELRRHLEQQAAEQGWPALHRRLCQVDPEAGRRIHPNDAQRIQRALEVWELSGSCMSELWRTQRLARPQFRLLRLVLAPRSRKLLHHHIAQRFQNMLERGLIEEVEQLQKLQERAAAELPALRLVGYRQVWSHLQGKIDYQEMIDAAIAATRQLARRQLTWLRAEPESFWLQAESSDMLPRVLDRLHAESIGMPG